jgi:glycyl-tRNA synthetase beta chain
MADFLPLLVELGTEELPPKALPELAQAFHDGVLKGLAARRIVVKDAGPESGERRQPPPRPAIGAAHFEIALQPHLRKNR